MIERRPASSRIFLTGITTAMALACSQANASSFALIEQSVSGMGSAYAIGAAGIDDASTLFFNPAGMSRLSGSHLSAGLQIVNSRVDIDANAAYSNNPALLPDPPVPGGLGIAGDPISGTDSTDTDLTAAVPAGYITYQYSDSLWFGLAVNAHFGLETEYDDEWVGRYHATSSELITIDINPSLAFKVNDTTTLAVGISALYADGTLRNVIDGGLADTLAGGSQFVPDVTFAPGTFDLDARLEGDDWGYGFNVGVLFEPSDRTRVGLHYRHKIDLDITGDISVDHPLFPAPQKQGAKLPLTLPGSLSASIYHALNNRWAVMADWTRTDWSQIKHVNITLDDGSQNNNAWLYEDSDRFSVGAEFRYSPAWTFRAGVAHDETPVPHDSNRSPRVPDADRAWLSAGATYRYSNALKFDFGYAHLFVNDPKMDAVSDANDPATYGPVAGSTGFHSLSGDYDAAVDIVGVQLNWKFR